MFKIMNREIKFEYGFESVNGTVKKVYHLQEIPNIQQKCDVWNVLPIKYVRQYTGFKDIEGKEIYEGDIVETSHAVIRNALVVFAFGGFQFQSFYEEVYISQKMKTTFKITGNIYENPELLKK